MKNSNVCCTCGRDIPEGRLICPICEKRARLQECGELQTAPALRGRTDKLGIAISVINVLMLIAIFIKVVSL
ncbi:MAG: hypothetical protein IKU19_06105 [Clostridia bacterium]|nr:hypothetical protein [Clostridia bacterium]